MPDPVKTQVGRRVFVSEEAARFAAFRAHVSASGTIVGTLLTSFASDAAAGNFSATKQDATSIHAWSRAEADWLDANDAAGCYANVYRLWDSLRTHAAQAATDALADTFDQAATELNAAMTASTNVAATVSSVAC